MRNILTIVCIILILVVNVHADEMDYLIEEQLKLLNLEELQRFIDDIVIATGVAVAGDKYKGFYKVIVYRFRFIFFQRNS